MIFVIAWAVLFAQVWWTCESEPGWKTQPRPQYDLGRNAATAQIINELTLLGTVILSWSRFASFIKITTVVSLAHAYVVLSDGGLKEAVAAMIESSVSLIVANLSAVVAFLLSMSAEDDS